MSPFVYCLLLVGGWASGLQAAGEENAIVPGEKIGQVALGSSLEAVEKVLGPASATNASAKVATDTWVSKAVPPEETSVVFAQGVTGSNPARQISVSSAFFHTPAGNSTKSDVAALWEEFPSLRYYRYGDQGDTSHVQLYDDREKGIAVMIQLDPHPAAGESWGRCRAIIVHRRGERPEFVNLGHALLSE